MIVGGQDKIEAFPNDEALWQTLPGVMNSAGNLALHIEGNLREVLKETEHCLKQKLRHYLRLTRDV